MCSYKTYYIYLLSNPINQKIFYVGCTSCLKVRRRQHFLRFKEMFNGMPPVFTIVDFDFGYGISKGIVKERQWIKDLASKGHELINKRMLTA